MIKKMAGVCLLAGAAAATGVLAYHAAPALTSITPLRRRLAPRLSGIGDSSRIALTFDDGPHPQGTLAVLEILREHRIRATFFVLGTMLTRYPEIGKEILAAGQEIALHGHEHRLLLNRGPHAVHEDLATGRKVIEDLLGLQPRWWRPPYGVLTTASLHAARRLDLTPVLWTAWGRDWSAKATPASVLRTVDTSLRPGGTVLLHDSDSCSFPGSWRTTVAALPRLIEKHQRAGITLGALQDHQLGSAGGRER